MLSIQDYNQSKSVKGLVQKIFESRQVVHVLHLKTKSYSEHIALKEYYEKIIDFADDFVETYQGQYGILNDYEINTQQSPNDSVKYLEDSVTLFKVGREFLKDAHLQNLMDEIISLTYKTLYKLKFLK